MGKQATCRGMTLIEIMTVIGIIGILLLIAIPGWLRQREQSRGIACQENLTKIEHAKEMYIFDHNLTKGASVVIEDLYEENDNTGYLKKRPICPAGGTYNANEVDSPPTCSYNGFEIFATTAQHKLPN